MPDYGRRRSLAGRWKDQDAAPDDERDNRAVRLGRKLRGLQHGKSAYVQTDREDRRSPVQLVVGSCNLTTSSKANYEAGVALEISQESETAKKWLRAFEEIYEGGITIEDHEGAA